MSSAREAGRLLCRDAIDRLLLAAAARGVHRQTCLPLDHLPVLGRHTGLVGVDRSAALADTARAQAVDAEDVCGLDAEDVASWIVGHYPASHYPGVLFGSPHGATTHLAAATGMPWLPTSFTVRVRRPDDSLADWFEALKHGAAIAGRLVDANPGITVRQVYDPVRQGPVCAGALTLHVQWTRLPGAYRRFLGERLASDAPTAVLRDTRTWPVSDLGNGHSFQLGSPGCGWDHHAYTMANPSFRDTLGTLGGTWWIPPFKGAPERYAELSGEPAFERDLRVLAGAIGQPTHRVLYPGPDTLSGAVADLLREWLRGEGADGGSCVVETDRLLDPWQALAAGVVPYWCETSSRAAVTGAEMWLAGSRRFDSVQALPAPPGVDCDAYAEPRQWRAAASFGRAQGWVSREAARRYPFAPLPTSYAAETLRLQYPRRAVPSPLSMVEVLGGLRRHGEPSGLLVL